jgi:ubiquinone/menaquinone biosynthesis C-methylase UbiE
MNRICANRMLSAGLEPKLTRSDIQTLPYGMNTFEQAVATFPTEALFREPTVKELARIIKPHGKLVVIPMVFITGSRMSHKLVAWLYRITGQTPAADKVDEQVFKSIFSPHGFELSQHHIKHKNYTLIVIEARLRE